MENWCKMNIPNVLSLTPDYRTFLTVDELTAQGKRLAETYSGSITRYSVGKSRNGEDLWCLQLGSGAKNALCFACPHPNEPIGAMTLLTLAERLAQDPQLLKETGMTWYLIPCIDPDGTRLNENWFKGPFTLEQYIRGFYRPSGSRQVEWMFPFRYENMWFDQPLPETRALMDFITTLRPALTYSLHNSAFGGAYWYVTHNNEAFHARLEAAACRQAVPLHRGDTESPYIVKYSRAVHSMMSLRQYYDYRAKLGIKLPEGEQASGTCSADYIATVCDSLVLIAEVPYFLMQGIDNGEPSDVSRNDTLRRKAARRKEHSTFLRGHWNAVRALFYEQNPFPYFVDDALCVYESEDGQAEAASAQDRPATKAEVLDSLQLSRIFEALDLALAIRACAFAIEHRNDAAEITLLQNTKTQIDERLTAMCRTLDAVCTYDAASIRRLVSVQLESVLVALDYCP